MVKGCEWPYLQVFPPYGIPSRDGVAFLTALASASYSILAAIYASIFHPNAMPHVPSSYSRPPSSGDFNNLLLRCHLFKSIVSPFFTEIVLKNEDFGEIRKIR